MKHVVTTKLKLYTTPEQFQALRQTQLAYRDALNAVSRYAFEHGKMSNQEALQRGMYGEIRAIFKLPAMSLAKSERPLRHSGRRSSRMPRPGQQARPRNATRGWIPHPSTCLLRSPTTIIGTTA